MTDAQLQRLTDTIFYGNLLIYVGIFIVGFGLSVTYMMVNRRRMK